MWLSYSVPIARTAPDQACAGRPCLPTNCARAVRPCLPPLRQVRLLRALALLHGALGDMSTRTLYLLDATDVATSAGLLDQSMALTRQLAAAPGAR
jgi:hypothetical protein